MKIKLIVILLDKKYLLRLGNAFDSMFSDKLQVSYFSDFDLAIEKINNGLKSDVILLDTNYKSLVEKIKSKTVIAYFSDLNEVDTYNGLPCISKYQRVDLIYRDVLRLFSEKSNSQITYKIESESNCFVTAVVSASGGVGSSTVASALAKYKRRENKNVVYLNFETLGSTNLFFYSDGAGNMSNIIFALKSKNSNLPLKLSSEVKHSSDGVAFFDDCDIALDKISLSSEEITQLISAIRDTNQYQMIVIDMDFLVSDYYMEILNTCDRVIFVSDGSQISNYKTKKAIGSISILENQNDSYSIISKSVLLYNKFSSRNGRKIEDIELETIGGINKIEGLSEDELSVKLSENSIFANI